MLGEGFAHIYHQKPKFPVAFLAQYLKNHNQQQREKTQLVAKLDHNLKVEGEIKQKEQERAKEEQGRRDADKKQKDREEAFEFRIGESDNYHEMLNPFCEWMEQEQKLTGVYIGELENATKKIDLDKEDSEEAHIDPEAPKLVRFKAASHSHNALMIGKTLSLESVVGKLLTEKPEEGGGE